MSVLLKKMGDNIINDSIRFLLNILGTQATDRMGDAYQAKFGHTQV